MMPKEPMRGATLFSHANKMTKAYHVMLTPLCKEAGLPPLAMDILLFLANNPEHNTAKDICRLRGHKPGIVSVHVERLVNDGLLERQEMPGDRRQTRLICTEQAQALIERGRQVQWQFGRRLLEGIPEEDLPKVFERFYRVDKARSRQAGGSGLGLSIVHDMVLRNDSTISVAPRPEGGTCFTVVFPAFDIEEDI